MIFNKDRAEFIVGLFVFFGLCILALFLSSMSGARKYRFGYPVGAVFNFVNGVKSGAPVRFAGVDVGEVREVVFLNKDSSPVKVKLVCWVKNDIHIPSDSTVWINTLGIIGEKYIEIMPGKDFAQCLSPGAEIKGIDPVPLHEMLRLSKDIVSGIDEGIVRMRNKEGTLGRLLFDDSLYNSLDELVNDVKRNPWKLLIKTKEKPAKK